MAAKGKSNEIALTRVYDAPLRAVWDAWTDPEQAGKWWGPRGFTLTTHSHDLRTGGSWNYTMHGPDGTDYPNTTKYLEVVEGSKLLYDHGGHDDRPPLFRVTALFSEAKGKTTLQMTMALATAEAAEETKNFIKKAGGNATWDRLAEYLEQESTGKEKFVITRTFASPLQTMFTVWTDPKHLAQWLPPTGMTVQFIRADIRPGGSTFYLMSGNGMTMYGGAEYVEIKSPDRIVYKQTFRDEHGNISRHPKAPTWPETMLTTVQLAEEAADETRVTVTWEPFGKVSAEELAAFVQMKASMTMGWTGSFDKLEDHLAKA